MKIIKLFTWFKLCGIAYEIVTTSFIKLKVNSIFLIYFYFLIHNYKIPIHHDIHRKKLGFFNFIFWIIMFYRNMQKLFFIILIVDIV
jgi:hypothetical protein